MENVGDGGDDDDDHQEMYDAIRTQSMTGVQGKAEFEDAKKTVVVCILLYDDALCFGLYHICRILHPK